MAAYLIFIRDRIRDEAELGTYAPLAQQSTAGHTLEPLVFYGPVETLEGAEADGVVLLKFADTAAARAWYDSPAYVEARKHRFLGGDYRVVITEGV